MAPISELIAQHPKLASKLGRFSFRKAAQLVGGLGVLPELLENTIRIEILAHLVTSCCRGDVEPKPSELAAWIGKFMDDSPAARMEDPAEDLFVGCVNSEFGSFRIFQGNFGDGAFLVERLVAFYAEKLNFPTFQETIDRVLALLRLSDALAERAGLSRYCAGGGSAAERIRIPKWRDFEPKVRSVAFSDEDLRLLEIAKPLLADFFLNEEHRANLTQEVMWSSSLERHPILEVENGLIVIEPSTLSRTAVRFMIERMSIMGGWGETFYQKDNASTFVNEVRSQLKVESLAGFAGPKAEEGTPFMFPYVGVFDHGKPVIMLTYTPPLANAVEDFAGLDEFNSDEQSKFENYIQRCASDLEKRSGFSGGMVLVCFAGYGRGGSIGLAEWSPKWRIHCATLRDWLAVTDNGECSAMRLWKLGEHETRCHALGVELLNPAGLPNLVAFWKKSNFRLVPREMDIHQENKLAVIDSSFAKAIRVTGTQLRDEHCIRSHDGKSWVRIVRHNARSLFPTDSDAPIYGAIVEARRRLIGCTERGAGVWWVISPESPERGDLRDLLYQLWDCILNWIDHLVLVAEREWPTLRKRGVEIRLELPDFNRWEHGQPGSSPIRAAELTIEPQRQNDSVTLTIPEGFLQHFNVPKNSAERRIVEGIIGGAAQLAGGSPSSEQIAALACEVMRNDDARYFHVVETRQIEQLLGSGHRPRPLFVADEDIMLSELGLADLAGGPTGGGVITGQEECRKFLKDTVEKIWERIEARLGPFDRASVVTGCFRALDEIARDEAHWNLTTRSLFALHDDLEETRGVLRDRRSKWSEANLCNRLLIETAQYACLESPKIEFNAADHAILLAELSLLLTFAHHRDGIAAGFLKPEVKIHPNGEIEVDQRFYAEMFSRYLSHRSDSASDRASDDYDKHFGSPRSPSEEESANIEGRIAKLTEVFEPEFGFSVEKLFKVMDFWRDFAIKTKVSGGYLTEPEMLALLGEGCDFSVTEADAFLNRLTLPIRKGWEEDLPPRCKKEDVYPWRFRRNLSLLVRPLVQVSASPRTWAISAPFFETSVSYLVGNIEAADFPERFFANEKMRKYVGQQVNRRGHLFAEKVYRVFLENHFAGRLEIQMTELGAPKGDGLGDVDVLAWSQTTGQVFSVECKRLLIALSVREVIQRLEDFRGDKKAKDSGLCLSQTHLS
jgi:hypothetical protein